MSLTTAVTCRWPPGTSFSKPPVALYASQCVSSKQSDTFAWVESAAGVTDVTVGCVTGVAHDDQALLPVGVEALDERRQRRARRMLEPGLGSW